MPSSIPATALIGMATSLRPQVSLLKQHMGHLVVVRIDKEALHPADLTIGGTDALAVTHLCFTRRDNLLDNGSCGLRHAVVKGHPACRRHGRWLRRRRPGWAVPFPFHQFRHLCGIELAELGDGTAQPDFADLGIN